MNIGKLCALTLLSLSASSLPGMAMAQQSLAEYARDGQRDIVLTAITSPDVDVDERAPDGSTALLWATYAVDHELVRALLDAGAMANVTNDFGTSPLIEAVKLGDVELVGMLLAAGADADSPNRDNQTALMLASGIGSLEIAELLIEHGADVTAVESFRGQNALMWAAGENHPEIVDLLLVNGAHEDLDRRAVHDDWPRQMTSEPRAQFRQTGGLTALLYATRSGCYRCAVAIVEAGADIDRPNPDGITPLLNAIDARNYDIAMYLIDRGANVHVWDMHGRTPLYMAVDMNSFRGNGGAAGGGILPLREAKAQDFGAMDVVHRLLGMGVDGNHQLTRMRPNGPGRGRFADYMMRGGTGPLMVTALAHDHEAMQALLNYGVEVDLRNVFQITPLMAAAGMAGTGRSGGGRGGGRSAGSGHHDDRLAAPAPTSTRRSSTATRTRPCRIRISRARTTRVERRSTLLRRAAWLSSSSTCSCAAPIRRSRMLTATLRSMWHLRAKPGNRAAAAAPTRRAFRARRLSMCCGIHRGSGDRLQPQSPRVYPSRKRPQPRRRPRHPRNRAGFCSRYRRVVAGTNFCARRLLTISAV